jgi:hypothetical protein
MEIPNIQQQKRGIPQPHKKTAAPRKENGGEIDSELIN